MDLTNRKLNFAMDRFSGIYLWVGFIVVFGIWSPHIFLTMSTVHLLASTQAVAGIIGIAVLIPMVSGQFDLSVGANANLTGLVAVVLQARHGWSLAETLVFCLAIGLFVGLVNGVIVVRFKVNSFIATLGMGSILSAFSVIVTNGEDPPIVNSTAWTNMTQYSVFGFSVIIYIMLVFALVAWWVLQHTPAGRRMQATGGNAEAARLSGIRVNRISWASLTASGGIAGAGGILYTSLTGPSLTFGSTLLLPAFAAVFLGSTQLLPGRFNVWGMLLAIFVLATGVEGLQLVSGVQWISEMFNGVALIIAVAMAASRTGRTPHRTRRAKPAPEGSERPSETQATGSSSAQPQLTGSTASGS